MLRTLNVRSQQDTFEPALFSIEELHWLADHLTEPPVSVFMDPLPPLVNRVQVEAALTRVYELQQLEAHRKIPWAGIGAIRDSIERYLAWQDRAAEIRRRTRGQITNPSMFHWDDTGRPVKYAIGADSCQLVRTEILPDGTRRPFAVLLTGRPEAVLAQTIADVAPWVKNTANPALAKDELIYSEKQTNGTIRCPICDHTEQYVTGSRAKKMAATGRMARHLKGTTIDINRHRMLHTRTFRR